MAKRKPITSSSLVLVALVAALAGAMLVCLVCKLIPKDYSPAGIVLVADDSVKAPRDLIAYLEKENKDDCKDYKGTNTVQGVTITSIYQVVHDKYAKLALGCSTNLDEGAAAVKTAHGWITFSGASYNLSLPEEMPGETLTYPRCSIVDKYHISKDFEPYCLEDKGEAIPKLDDSDLRAVAYP